MTDQPERIESDVSDAEPAPPRRSSPLRRAGCAILLILWFLLLLTPCPIGILLTREEISIPMGDLPGQRLRVWLIMEADARGLGVSSPSVLPGADDDTLCLQTDVSYLLWHGREDPVAYCECYARSSDETGWEYVNTIEGRCTGEGGASE